MDPIITVQSEWILAYYFGLSLALYLGNRTQKWGLIFHVTFLYMLTLTIGLRISYG